MNYMKQVADMLGVQFGEWFEIRESWGDKKVLGEGRLSRLGLEEKNRGLAGACLPLLTEILLGEFEIKRLPWVPKMGETYWYVYKTSNGWEIHGSKVFGTMLDLNNISVGNCFSTYKAAEDDKGEVIARYNEILGRLKE